MLRCLAILVAASGALAATRVSAHHSITALYHEKQTVTVEGQLAQVHFRNPHTIVHLIVKDKTAGEVRYAVEWAAAGELEAQGVTSRTLKAGDFVVITGSPARYAPDRRLRMTTLHRPKDNYTYDGR